jgi:hypothetical protein
MAMKSKRGLSEIISTVLIVLLALAGIVIVWIFLRPIFDTTGTRAQLKSACFEAEAEGRCDIINDWKNESALNVSVIVKLMSGEAYQILAILTKEDGSSAMLKKVDSPGALGSELILWHVAVSPSGGIIQEDYVGKYPSITVAPIIRDEAGNEETCAERVFNCRYTPTCSPGLCELCLDQTSCDGAIGGSAACHWASGQCLDNQ